LLRDGRKVTGFGLTESRRFTIAPPGRLPLGSRRFSLVDAPDLRVLPALWPLREVWMGAGTVPEIMHRVLNLCAFAVRLRLLPSLLPVRALDALGEQPAALGRASRRNVCGGPGRARRHGTQRATLLAHDRRRRRRSVHSRDGLRGDHPELSLRENLRLPARGRPRAMSSSKTMSGCSRAARSRPARAKSCPPPCRSIAASSATPTTRCPRRCRRCTICAST
jgi:hypothetical protein